MLNLENIGSTLVEYKYCLGITQDTRHHGIRKTCQGSNSWGPDITWHQHNCWWKYKP